MFTFFRDKIGEGPDERCKENSDMGLELRMTVLVSSTTVVENDLNYESETGNHFY